MFEREELEGGSQQDYYLSGIVLVDKIALLETSTIIGHGSHIEYVTPSLIYSPEVKVLGFVTTQDCQSWGLI